LGGEWELEGGLYFIVSFLFGVVIILVSFYGSVGEVIVIFGLVVYLGRWGCLCVG